MLGRAAGPTAGAPVPSARSIKNEWETTDKYFSLSSMGRASRMHQEASCCPRHAPFFPLFSATSAENRGALVTAAAVYWQGEPLAVIAMVTMLLSTPSMMALTGTEHPVCAFRGITALA